MRLRSLVLLMLLLLVLRSATQAQSLPYDLASGLQPFQSYHGGDIDEINLSNGDLHVHIPLVSYPQRGGKLKLDFALEYNGKPFSVVKDCSGGPPCVYFWETPNELNTTPFPLSDWYIADEGGVGIDRYNESITHGGISQPFTLIQWQTPDAAVHPGALVSLANQSGQVSLDGTGFFTGVDYSNNCLSHCYTVDSSGTVYRPSSSILREDSNGNNIVVNGSGGYVDTIGRTIPAIPATPTSSNSGSTTGCTGPLPIYATTQWLVPGANGSTSTFNFCYVQLTINLPAHDSAPAYSTPVVKLQSVVLPNLQAWTFEYNSRLPGDPQTLNYGDLTKITFPTGGTISYQYTLTRNTGLQTASMWMQSRTIDANDGTGPHPWTYSLLPFGGTVPNTVTDPDGNVTSHTFQNFGAPGSPTLFETKTQYYSGSSTLLKTVQTSFRSIQGQLNFYAYQGLNVLPTSVTTTLDNDLSTTTNLQYCCDVTSTPVNAIPAVTFSYGRVSDSKIYDYGASGLGPLLRETATVYQFQNNPPYLTANMMDLVASETVYDGGGNQAASSANSYDESSYLTASGVSTQHTSPITAVRGNLTSVSRWLNGGTNPVSHTNWYDSGVPYQTLDPLTHSTTYGYSSTYAGALPTTITDALNYATTYTYDFNTGQKLTVKDPNSQTTTYSYVNPSTGVADPLNRLISVKTLDGGETDIQYNDTGNIGVTVTEKINSSLNKQTQAIVDGLGRLSETILLSDPVSATYTLTTYDALGRKYQFWNPTRCTPTNTPCSGEFTWGITTYGYDALSRPLSQTDSDGVNTQGWSYAGNQVTFTDEDSNHWQRTYDPLGRLRDVMEPNGASQIPSLETGYTYDALNNLTSVTQWGGVSGSSGARIRSSTYDSLSRLIQAYNPEPGWVCYGTTGGAAANGSNCTSGYDADGNMSSKTDARGVVTGYSYDALNRLYAKTYTNAPAGTMSSCYQYDTATNGIGRLSAEWTQAGSCASAPPANYQSLRKFGAYDAMGRVLTEQQCAAGYCTSASVPSQPAANCSTLSSATGLQYCYDLAGNLLAYGNGLTTAAAGQYQQQAILFAQTFDAAGRLNSVGSSWSDSTHPQTLFSNSTYTPANALSSWLLGSSLWTARQYDSRLRVCNQQSAQSQITAPACQ
ncbi:MAG: hypothetical protein WBQ94_11075 [Terracidiphilus sp.]